jgi:nucleotide-binding universal stress UspA family protein
MFKKVLVAVDFSGPALELLNAVPDLIKMGLEELIIIHVIRMEIAGRGIGAHRRRFLSQVEEKRKELEEQGVKVKIYQPVGSPVEEIRNSAEEENVSLILIGSIGEGSLVRELFLGSTVADVIRVTKKPVLIEKYSKESGKPVRKAIFREGQAATALLATDFSRHSLQIFDFFKENPGIFDKVILLHVVDEGYTVEQVEENKKKAVEKLKVWQQEFKERGMDAEISVVVGISSEEIVKVAGDRDVALTAISRRGRGMIDELIIGSTADPVVRRSNRPILLMKG